MDDIYVEIRARSVLAKHGDRATFLAGRMLGIFTKANAPISTDLWRRISKEIERLRAGGPRGMP